MAPGQTGVELYEDTNACNRILFVNGHGSGIDTVRTVRSNEHPPLRRHCQVI